MTAEGKCPGCGTTIPGLWPASQGEVRTGHSMADYYERLPRRVQM